MSAIDILRVLYCTPFLLYSCHTDILTRRVSNQVWVVMLTGGSLFAGYDIINSGIPALIRLILSVCTIFIFVYILFQFGTFGGADAKCLIVLSIIIPVYPHVGLFGLRLPLIDVPYINLFTFTVFGNAVILTIVVPLALFIYNLFTLKPQEIVKKPAYLFIGFKKDISGLPGKHIKLIEEYYLSEDELHTRFRRGGVDISDDIVKQLETYAKNGLMDRRVWVTPGMPFMIPITVGFFTAVIFGDLIFYLTKLLLIM
jgi:preflagellin peptidase FlaK